MRAFFRRGRHRRRGGHVSYALVPLWADTHNADSDTEWLRRFHAALIPRREIRAVHGLRGEA